MFFIRTKYLGGIFWTLETLYCPNGFSNLWQMAKRPDFGFSDVEENTAVGTCPAELAFPQMESFTEG